MTYNLMRVFEEVSKRQDPELIHRIKNIPKYWKKEIKLPKKEEDLLTHYFFSQESYA